MFSNGVSGEAKVIYMMNQYSIKNQGLAQKKLTKIEKLEFNQCVAKCCSCCNTLEIFFLHSNFRAILGLSLHYCEHLSSFHELSLSSLNPFTCWINCHLLACFSLMSCWKNFFGGFKGCSLCIRVVLAT